MAEETAREFLRRHALNKSMARFQPLLRFLKDTDSSLYGHVSRDRIHYVHERSTTLCLETDFGPGKDASRAGKQVDALKKEMSEQLVNINRRIYRDLEEEWAYQTSDEAVADSLDSNEMFFEEDGTTTGEDDPGFSVRELPDRVRARVLDNYRQWNVEDNDWFEHVIETWTSLLAELGFDGVEIAFTGFSTQGDGASFTAKSLDVPVYIANYDKFAREHLKQ